MNTFQTPGPINAMIEIVLGDVRVTASDRADSVVTVRPRDESKTKDIEAARNAVIEFNLGVLTVKTVKSWARIVGPSKNDGAVVAEIEIPTGSSISAYTGMGAIYTDGELGDAQVKSGMGNLRLDQVGELYAKTGFGDVMVDGIAGDATVSTGTGLIQLGSISGSSTVKNSNGTVTIAALAGPAHVKTASGDITIGRATTSLTATTAAGKVRIGEVSEGSVTVKTGAGPVDIGVREGSAAWLEVESKYGVVRNDLTTSGGPESSDSTVEVRVRTGAGDITINRAAAA